MNLGAKKTLVTTALIFGLGGFLTLNYLDYKEHVTLQEKLNSKEEEVKVLKREKDNLGDENDDLKKDIADQNKMLLKRDDDLKTKHNRIILLKNTKNERIEYLKKELKKKPKVIYKTEYKERIVYKKEKPVQQKPQVSTKSVPVEKKQKVVEKVSKETGELPTKKQPVNNGMTFQMTSYTADCSGCSGITATGVNVKSTTTVGGMRVIAVDPNIIPLGSTVRVTTSSGSFTAKALDTGGAIKGNIIDLLVGSSSEAQTNGRQQVKVQILN